jgi:hypothetical protein
VKLGVLLGAAVLAAPAASVEPSEFRYTRSLPDEVAGGEVAFEPDGLMIAHTRPALADVRIIDADGVQVPWRRVPVSQIGSAPAEVLNSGRRNGMAVALVDVGPRRRLYERVALDIPRRNFVGRVTVLGADRRNGPYTRLSTTTVYDVGGAERARSTTAEFPPTDFRFLEVRATGVSRIEGATVLGQYERPRLVRRRHAILAGAKDRGRTSVYDLDLGVRGIPVLQLDLRADGSERYDRPVRVEGSNDRRAFVPVGGGRVTRAPGLSAREIPIDSRFRYLRVTIENGDDPPLSNVVTETYGPSFALMVEGGHPVPLRLLYGARSKPAPSYEFARLPAERPLELVDPARLPPERLNAAFAVPEPPFGERHGWIVQLALVLAAAVVAVGGFLALRRRA